MLPVPVVCKWLQVPGLCLEVLIIDGGEKVPMLRTSNRCQDVSWGRQSQGRNKGGAVGALQGAAVGWAGELRSECMVADIA